MVLREHLPVSPLLCVLLGWEMPLTARLLSAFHFFAGLSTGVFSASLLQPIDLLKTRVQQSGSSSLASAIRDIAQGSNYLLRFWRGTTPSIIRTGLGSALYFSILNALRQNAATTNILASTGVGQAPEGSNRQSSSALPKLSNTANLTTGALARASAGSIMTPVTVIKVRYESSFYSYTSILGAVTAIFRREGLKGFFSGFGATAVRDAPYAGLYVLFYEQCKARLNGAADSSSSSQTSQSQMGMISSAFMTTNFISGVVAAGIATTITNPFDAIKTRLQLSPHKYRNMIRAGRIMVTEDGGRSLFNGLGLRIGRKAISSALTWTLYEELVRQAEDSWQREDRV